MKLQDLEKLCKKRGLDLVPFYQTPHTGGTVYNNGNAVATYWHKLGGYVDVTWLVKELAFLLNEEFIRRHKNGPDTQESKKI